MGLIFQNELLFSDYSNDFFIKNPEYSWKHVLGCPGCEKSNYHEIKIFVKDQKLTIDIDSETVDPEQQTHVDISSIYYSLSSEDVSQYSMELPLEFDLIDVIVGNDFFGSYKKAIKEIEEILKLKEVQNSSILRKLIFSNVITVFETYLFDLIINALSKTNRRS